MQSPQMKFALFYLMKLLLAEYIKMSNFILVVTLRKSMYYTSSQAINSASFLKAFKPKLVFTVMGL